MKLTLTIKADYKPRRTPRKILERVLNDAAQHLASHGLLTGETDAVVDSFEVEVSDPTRQRRILGIVLDGGVVQSVVSTPACLPEGCEVMTIDYDTDGALDEDITPIPQRDGTMSRAIVGFPIVEPAQIPLRRIAALATETIH